MAGERNTASHAMGAPTRGTATGPQPPTPLGYHPPIVKSSPRRHRSSWPWAVASMVIVALLVGGALYLYRTTLSLPGKALEAGREVLGELRSVAAAFRQGSFETSFRGYTTSLEGTSRLQFATLKQQETFDLRDRAAVFWGEIELPEIVVEATAPVEYTYFVDFAGEWSFELSDDTLQVLAPPIEHNEPAIDASRLDYRVRTSSLIRDEAPALEQLKASLGNLARRRARQQLPLVREVGRRELENFVRNWLVEAFGDGGDYAIEVRFADELKPKSPVLERLEERRD
ncbi:MAG: hypothetical protein AAF604_20515 [Acidobacteriota bacterium]